MINLFFSYSHKDEGLRNELDKHLSILKRQGIITAWHDRRIHVGADLDKEISKNIQDADLILLLISSDFIASDYCYDNEMKLAIEKHEKGESVVIPVILRPCDWHDTPFGKLLATPTDGKPVIKFASLDDAFLEITNHIKTTVAVINRKNPTTVDSSKSNFKDKKLPRSGNLKIAKNFSDQEKDAFLDEAFEYIANYFEGSLTELKNRNSQIDFRFKRADSQTFTGTIYKEGSLASECMIFSGSNLFLKDSINYSTKISSSKNSYNEAFHLEDNGYIVYFRPTGFYTFGRSGMIDQKEQLTNEGVAEYLWQIFIEPLQRAH